MLPARGSVPDENSRSEFVQRKKITSHQKIFINMSTYVPRENRLKTFVLFLSLSAFFFDRADLPLCLCRKVSREELKHRNINTHIYI